MHFSVVLILELSLAMMEGKHHQLISEPIENVDLVLFVDFPF